MPRIDACARKSLKSLEIIVVPAVEVKFGSAARIARLIAARPGANEAAFERRQSVTRDVEGALWLDIGPTERARVVQPIGRQRVEILLVVDVEIQHRAVVLA